MTLQIPAGDLLMRHSAGNLRRTREDGAQMIYILIIAGIFAGDLLLKNHMEKRLEGGKEESLLGGKIILRKYHNTGVCLNVGERKQKAVAFLSLGLSLVAALVFLITLTRKGNGLLKAGLAILLGGAFSNTYDRLVRKYVVDYFSFGVKWKKFGNIVFNISDFCILIGSLLLVVCGSRD